MVDYKTAFITGASAGIGASLARLLASKGIAVGLAARREQELDKLASEIESAGGRAFVYPLDVSNAETVYATVRAADDEMDGLDLVVANAGFGKAQWSGTLTWDDISRMLMVNVVGAAATLTAAIPRMVERQRGHLVGISSLAAYRGLPKNAIYCGSKAFLSTMLESLRIDLHSKSIAVTDIRPGFVRTALTAGNRRMPMAMDPDQAAEEIAAAIRSRKAIHAFPIPMALGVRSIAALPQSIYHQLAQRTR